MNVAAQWGRQVIVAGATLPRCGGIARPDDTAKLPADLRRLLASSPASAALVLDALERLAVEPDAASPRRRTRSYALRLLLPCGSRVWIATTPTARRRIRREAAVNGEVVLDIADLLHVVGHGAPITVLGRRAVTRRKVSPKHQTQEN